MSSPGIAAMDRPDDFVVIGGGFYGCCIAELLARKGARVTLFERAQELLSRSSYNNQARLHGGYHYPRSFGTAYRSRLNFSRFMREFRPAIVTDFISLYAIARTNSKVNARQFETFCRNIEAPIARARDSLARLFRPHLIEAVYEVEEYVFDAAILRQLMMERLERAGVRVRLGQSVRAVRHHADALEVVLADGNCVAASRLFNCSYSNLNTIEGLGRTAHKLKHELTEMALIELPEELRGLSLTVMDGPFFSFMPFPDRKLATLSHVRYTPQAGWLEERDGILDPYATLDSYAKKSRFPQMIRDAMRYIPAIAGAGYRDSLFEVKTVLLKNEFDDGRPILFEKSADDPRIISVLGSKIDNVYDALTAVEVGLPESCPV
jgi:glycine/D-amino acid oxidase-like deaminating enzyme